MTLSKIGSIHSFTYNSCAGQRTFSQSNNFNGLGFVIGCLGPDLL